ncbi:DUF3040 domain-containing protein [Arthrobacter sp. ISL-28]|uniref:DUF3040 domain-containing protein n=1 Tax=Arthrobacter sp. ISL-28 TaxID=2819108 RepID=UPI001BEA7B4B|nr:DUF3040 domain-containing protein [Arthrobacter sp. ISL-28]MBT2521391.1 DUF3040 domain-containing protein [Arthrobacter sp. ISL-28]
MALSEHEKVVLEQLEQQFRMEDPKLAEAMEPARTRVPGHIVIAVAGIVAGLLLVVLGAVLQGLVPYILVGVLGFAVMITGGHFAVQQTSVSSQGLLAPV